jgi:hypothetical protein
VCAAAAADLVAADLVDRDPDGVHVAAGSVGAGSVPEAVLA